MFLIESADAGDTWRLLAEAHPSAARAYPALLDAAAGTAAWLFAAALRRPAAAAPAPAWHPPDQRRPMPLPRLRAAIAPYLAWLRDRLTAEAWAIAALDAPVEALLVDRTVGSSRWITVPVAEGFVADPFPWPGRPGVVLCERYFHRTGRGILQALSVEGSRILAAETLAIDPGCHLSYPVVWRDGDRVLCLPEMGLSRRQVLYELPPDAPAREVSVVAQDVGMADATPFWHEGRWWLAYTDVDLGLLDNLNLLYADRPEGPWAPCRANPVKIDVRSSRCGGTLFRAGGMLLRPAQDCSATYGGALVLNRVEVCTPDEYREVPIARLSPDPAGPFPHGLHTLSVGDGVILIDGKRELLNLRVVLWRIARRLGGASARPVETPAP
jgi:hypothetical protein